MKAYERMLKYIVVRTPSDGESGKQHQVQHVSLSWQRCS